MTYACIIFFCSLLFHLSQLKTQGNHETKKGDLNSLKAHRNKILNAGLSKVETPKSRREGEELSSLFSSSKKLLAAAATAVLLESKSVFRKRASLVIIFFDDAKKAYFQLDKMLRLVCILLF